MARVSDGTNHLTRPNADGHQHTHERRRRGSSMGPSSVTLVPACGSAIVRILEWNPPRKAIFYNGVENIQVCFCRFSFFVADHRTARLCTISDTVSIPAQSSKP